MSLVFIFLVHIITDFFSYLQRMKTNQMNKANYNKTRLKLYYCSDMVTAVTWILEYVP